jgi:hypothetical protein
MENDWFFKNRHGNLIKMTFFTPWIIEVGNDVDVVFFLAVEKTGYYPHRDMDEADPRFSSKVLSIIPQL